MEVNFCPECDNILYIYTNDDNEIYHGCKYCKYNSLKKLLNADITLKDSNCVYNTQKLIGGLDLIKDNKYLQHDITIPHLYSNKNLKCLAECCKGKRTKIRYINYDSDNMKYLYMCDACGNQWTNK